LAVAVEGLGALLFGEVVFVLSPSRKPFRIDRPQLAD
jgi:hypothetical protein